MFWLCFKHIQRWNPKMYFPSLQYIANIHFLEHIRADTWGGSLSREMTFKIESRFLVDQLLPECRQSRLLSWIPFPYRDPLLDTISRPPPSPLLFVIRPLAGSLPETPGQCPHHKAGEQWTIPVISCNYRQGCSMPSLPLLLHKLCVRLSVCERPTLAFPPGCDIAACLIYLDKKPTEASWKQISHNKSILYQYQSLSSSSGVKA